MRTGKALILATKPYTVDSSVRSWWCILSTTFLLVGTTAGTIWNFHLMGRVICSIFTGLLVLRLFVIYHDQRHHAILHHSRLAGGLMKLFGILYLSPNSIWQSSHNHHHSHNSRLRGSHIGSFPIMTVTQYLRSSKAKRFNYLFLRHPLTIIFGYIFMFLYGMCLVPFITKPRQHVDCLFALLLHLAISVSIVYFLSWGALLLTQVIPCFIAYGIGSYLCYAQHNFPGVLFYDKARWTHDRAALESSSFLKTGLFMGWFTANIGYHHIHHLNARIPFYRLPEVINAIPELTISTTTSLHPLEIVRCLRLKLWDVEQKQMVSLRDLNMPATKPT